MKTRHLFVFALNVCAIYSLEAIPAPRISTAPGQYTTNQITVEGTASSASGITSIQYLINGEGPQTAMRPNTNNWNKWQAAINLQAGSNIFQVWATGANGSSATNKADFFLIVKSPMSVSVVGGGKVIPNYNGQNLIIDKSYAMVAERAAGQVFVGWSGSVTSETPTVTFLMQEGENMTATFEPSPFTNGLLGVYDGLFYDANNLFAVSAGYLTLSLGSEYGVFSGTLTIKSSTESFTGTFDSGGMAQLAVRQPGIGDLQVSLSLDLSGSTGLTGSVVCTNTTNAFEASLQAYKVHPQNSNYVGYYTWAMNGASVSGNAAPDGFSYGTITVPKQGVATIYLYLSDGYSTVTSGYLTQDGVLPLYLPLPGVKGSLSGWLSLNTNDLTLNTMDWFESKTGQRYYTNGFALTDLALALSPFNKGTNNLGSNVVIQLTEGDITAGTLTDYVTLGTKTNDFVTDTNHFVVSLSAQTGLFKGTYIDPVDGKSTTVAGVLVQPTDEAYGYFIPTNHLSGTVTVIPGAP